MDLNIELRRVLDNPESVYEEVVTNLATEARVTLMVLTSCKAPVDIVELQAAVARVSVEAATRFEASLRALDDAFLSLERRGTSRHAAQFRNPSIDDFCCAYLNKNAGFALTVAAKEPSFDQLRRLIELSTAPVAARRGFWAEGFGLPEPPPRRHSGGRWMYPDLHAALVNNPTLLLGKLLTRLERAATSSGGEFRDTVLALVDVVGAGDPDRVASPAALRSLLVPALLEIDFQNGTGLLWSLLDDRRRAQVTKWLLADRYDDFYRSLIESADELTHFDTIVNFDKAVDRSGDQAWWADRFESFNDGWLDDVGDADDAGTKRHYYEKVADHLDLGMRSALGAWEEAEAEAEAEQKRQDAAKSEDDWRDAQEEPVGSEGADHRHRASIDAMFTGLAQAQSR